MTIHFIDPLHLLRTGSDYIAIADRLGTAEHVIEKAIHRLRNAERLEDRREAYQIKYRVLRSLQKKARLARTRDDLRAKRPA